MDKEYQHVGWHRWNTDNTVQCSRYSNVCLQIEDESKCLYFMLYTLSSLTGSGHVKYHNHNTPLNDSQLGQYTYGYVMWSFICKNLHL